MDLWKIGFALLAIGIAIPSGYALYRMLSSSMEWYWILTVILIIGGILVLLAAAIRDAISEPIPEEKY